MEGVMPFLGVVLHWMNASQSSAGQLLNYIVILIIKMAEMIHLPKEEYESMKRTIEVLSKKEIVKMIRESQENIRKGRFQTLEEVEKELG